MNTYLKEDFENISEYIKDFDIKNSTFLITGATGFIGSYIVRFLDFFNQNYSANINILAMARDEEKVKKIYKTSSQNVKFLYADLTCDFNLPKGIDYIIHTASPTNSKYMLNFPIETTNAIILGTQKILEYAKNNKVKGVVYLSSMEVFGKFDSCEKLLEENHLGYVDLQNPRNCYPLAKRLAENMCKSYSVEYNVNVKIARLAQVFGAGVLPWENRVFSQFSKSVLKGEDIVLHTTGETIGNYCYISDTVKGIFLILNKGNSGECYTVVNENNSTSIKDMAKMVADNFSNGKSKVVFDIPSNNLYGYAETTKIRLSSKKLNNLGWKAEISLEESYRRMLPFIKEQL